MILLLFGLEFLALTDLLYLQFLLLLLVFLVLSSVSRVWSGAMFGSGQVLSVNSRARASCFRGWSCGLGSRGSSFRCQAIGFCSRTRSFSCWASSFTGWTSSLCSRTSSFTGWAIGFCDWLRRLAARASIAVRRSSRSSVHCSTFFGGYCAAVFEGAGLGCRRDRRLAMIGGGA